MHKGQTHVYMIWTKKDVRDPGSAEETVRVRAFCPDDAMRKVLAGKPPYTGACYAGMAKGCR